MLRTRHLLGLLAALTVPCTAAAQSAISPFCSSSVPAASPRVFRPLAASACTAAAPGARPVREARTYDANGLLVSVLAESWNATSAAWTPERRTAFTYDAAGRETESTHETYAGGVWTMESRIAKTYTAAGLVHVWLSQMWSEGAWKDNARTTYTYDAAGNETGVFSEMWFQNTWRNSFRSTKTYNAMRLVLDERYEMWTGTEWMLHDRHAYTYNAAGDVTLHVDYQMGDVPERREAMVYDALGRATEHTVSMWDVAAGAWVPFERDLDPAWLAGDPAHQMTAYRTQRWNAAAAAWRDSSRFQGTYSPAFKLLVDVTQLWDAGASAWVNNEKWEYEYDALGERSGEMLWRWHEQAWKGVFGNRVERTFNAAMKPIDETFWFWNETAQALVRESRHLTTYDAEMQPTEVVMQQWAEGAWANASRSRLSYRAGVAADDPALASGLRVNVWPQPARGQALLRLDGATGRDVRAVLYDVLGREVRTVWAGPLVVATEVPLGPLPSGRYLLRVSSNGAAQTLPVVMVR